MRSKIAALIALAAGPAFAQDIGQDTGWSYKTTAFLWLPDTRIGIDTSFGEVNGELEIGDAIKALDFAFMGSFEANRGKWSLIGDLVYFDLSAADPTPLGALFDSADVATQITALTAIAAYRVYETDKFALDLGGGFRAMSANTDVSLITAGLPPSTSSASDEWVDPIIAMRGRYDFSQKWFGSFYLDGGGFGVGSEQTYQAAVGVGYNLNDQWSLLGGWRYLDFERENNGHTLDFRQSGILLGASYRF